MSNGTGYFKIKGSITKVAATDTGDADSRRHEFSDKACIFIVEAKDSELYVALGDETVDANPAGVAGEDYHFVIRKGDMPALTPTACCKGSSHVSVRSVGDYVTFIQEIA